MTTRLLAVAMNTASEEAEVQLACLAVVIPGGGTVDEVDLKALMVGSCATPVFKGCDGKDQVDCVGATCLEL